MDDLTGYALINAIINKPDDDAPRLIYADWLEENERQDRAAYIREMVAKPSFIDVRDTSECPWIHERWFVSDESSAFEWNRGFIKGIRCSQLDWIVNGPNYVRKHPIQYVRLIDVRPAIDVIYHPSIDVINEANKLEWWLTPSIDKHAYSDFDMKFIRIKDESVKMINGFMYVPFSNISDSYEWISRRCIEWAKNEPY